LPVSAYRYLVAKRHADAFAKAQNGKGAEAETSNADRTETTRMSTDL
jgi:hypothetical protein